MGLELRSQTSKKYVVTAKEYLNHEGKPVDADENVHDNQARSVSSDELLDLEIPEYNAINDRKVVYNEESINCQDCESVFATKSGLLRHTKSKHKDVIQFCDHCEHHAITQGQLREHRS